MVNGSLTVNAKTLTITAANKTKTYGTAIVFDETDPSTDFSVSGLVNSDTVASITLTSAGAAGTAGVSGSPYTIVPSAAVGTGLGNYAISYVNGSLTVNAKTLIVTPDPQSRTYGDPVGSHTFTVAGFVNDEDADSADGYTDPSCTSDYEPTTPVADSPLTITCSAGTAANYTFDVSRTAVLTVNAKTLTITAANKTKTYGTAIVFDETDPSTDFSVSGLVNSDTVASITLTSAGAAGTAGVSGSPYTIVPSAAVGTGLGNYAISYVNGSLTVNAKTLTITAANKTKTYGTAIVFDETDPSTDFSVSGLVNSDTVASITLTSAGAAGTAGVSGSPYTIVPSAAVGTGLGNYAISYVNGSLTVNAKTLTITAANKTKTYGTAIVFDETDPSTDFSVSGLVNSDTVASITLTSAGAAGTAGVSGSPYTIVPSAAVGTGLGNYAISYVNGSLTVNAKTLIVTPDPQSRTYGDPVGSHTFTVAGFVNDEDADSADGYTDPSCTSDYEPTTPVADSPLTITCSGRHRRQLHVRRVAHRCADRQRQDADRDTRPAEPHLRRSGRQPHLHGRRLRQ
jgi:hypothetical protein